MKRHEDRKTAQAKLKEMRAKVELHAKAAIRLIKKVHSLKAEMGDLMKALHKTSATKFDEITKTLPEEQQVLVQTCFDAAKHHNSKNSTQLTGYMSVFYGGSKHQDCTSRCAEKTNQHF
ncbi:hypothetical protein FOCC_FOCC009658 [Frankliniella occidentalis]|nr:hypothetical protein FOCC_FOCC009658 [Frankliniella occidentalis]